MAKRGSKKKGGEKKVSVKKPKTPKRTVSAQSVEIKMQPILTENFITLQKVMVNLSSKLDGLTKQISDLLNIFETSAKTLAKKDFKFNTGENNQEIIERLNNLNEQNKIIASGLSMIHQDEQEQRQIVMAPPIIPQQLAPLKSVPTAKAPMPNTPAPKGKQNPEPQEEYQKSAPTFKPLKQ
jgi:hypothetical protein